MENLSEERQNLYLSTLTHYADLADRRAIERESSLELVSFAKTLGIVPYLDGNKWCALYGENLQEGLAGFGDSPIMAIQDLYNLFHVRGYK